MLDFVIVGINILLRQFCFEIVRKIAYDKESRRLFRTTKVIFWMQFINTAILLFVVNANMTQSPLTFGLVGGSLRDFNRTWFKIIGNTIIGTMIINVGMPVVESLMELMFKTVERCVDRGCCPKTGYETQKTGTWEYIELYAGIDHLFHYGYSTVLVTVFVTFMFGFGIPILFPIAACVFIVLYRVEKF